MKVEASNAVLATVIVLTRNRAQSLKRVLTALQKLDYPNYEILVVDNDSTDETRNVVKNFRVQYTHTPSHYGIGSSRQKGVESAKGEIIVFCDDDCEPHVDWLSRFVSRFVKEPDIGLLGGEVINTGFPSNNGTNSKQFKGRSRIGRNGKLKFVENPQDAEFFGNMNLAMRKDVISSVGGYDPFFNILEEIDLAIRIRHSGYRIDFEPSAVVKHHYTGVSYKRRHFFYGPELVRLYLCMKHFRPSSIKEWLSFLYFESRLLLWDIWKVVRRLLASISKGKFSVFGACTLDLFNGITARLAIPWLLLRCRRETKNKTNSS